MCPEDLTNAARNCTKLVKVGQALTLDSLIFTYEQENK